MYFPPLSAASELATPAAHYRLLVKTKHLDIHVWCAFLTSLTMSNLLVEETPVKKTMVIP